MCNVVNNEVKNLPEDDGSVQNEKNCEMKSAKWRKTISNIILRAGVKMEHGQFHVGRFDCNHRAQRGYLVISPAKLFRIARSNVNAEGVCIIETIFPGI